MTSCGLNGGPLEGKGTYEARIACNLQKRHGNRFYLCWRKTHPFELCFTQTGSDRECDPDQYIACMGNGCRAGFKYFRFSDAGRPYGRDRRGEESGGHPGEAFPVLA